MRLVLPSAVYYMRGKPQHINKPRVPILPLHVPPLLPLVQRCFLPEDELDEYEDPHGEHPEGRIDIDTF